MNRFILDLILIFVVMVLAHIGVSVTQYYLTTQACNQYTNVDPMDLIAEELNKIEPGN